jgi:hypothetical protein
MIFQSVLCIIQSQHSHDSPLAPNPSVDGMDHRSHLQDSQTQGREENWSIAQLSLVRKYTSNTRLKTILACGYW